MFLSAPACLAVPVLLSLLAWPDGKAFAAPPDVVVTIKPIHSLAVAVMDGIGTPKLLLPSASSPHSYALRPSDAEALKKAGVIVRVSANLEIFLDRLLRNLPDKAIIIDLDKTPGLTLLPVRKSGAFADAGDHGHGHSHSHSGTGTDVHFWLHPLNAMKIADYMAVRFGEIDPENAVRYKTNAAALNVQLAALHEELTSKLSPLKGKPYIVFHDVMQYFENLYGLTVVGAITVSPERQPGARRLAQIRAKIKELRAVCVLAEPQFPPRLVSTLVDGTQAKTGTFDEVGVETPPGAGQYLVFMRKNAENLAACAQG